MRVSTMVETLAEVEFEYNRVFTPEEQELIRESAITQAHFDADGKRENTYEPLIMFHSVLPILGSYRVIRTITHKKLSDVGLVGPPVINQKCNVAVPGLGLLAINQVAVRENYCTEELQSELENGWHILAICVQPDQRRPDYILGRTKE